MTGSSNNASVDRRLFIGGSDARIIMSAGEAALIRLRREKRGESEPDDLSDNLVVQLGVVERRIRKSDFDRVAEKADEDEEKKKSTTGTERTLRTPSSGGSTPGPSSQSTFPLDEMSHARRKVKPFGVRLALMDAFARVAENVFDA